MQDLSPELVQHLRSILSLHQAGKLADAERACRAALGLFPDHPKLLTLLGVLCGRSGRADEAAAVHGRLVTVEPGSAANWNNYATALQSADRIPDAIDALRRAIALKPDYANAKHSLAMLLALLRRFDE